MKLYNKTTAMEVMLMTLKIWYHHRYFKGLYCQLLQTESHIPHKTFAAIFIMQK